MGHVSEAFHWPPVLRVVDGRVNRGLLLYTAEDRQAPVLGHSGQVEPQLVQEVTGPEVIGVGA